MLKELIICIVIVVTIVALDITTQNFTEKTVGEISDNLKSLKLTILNGNSEEMKKEADNIHKDWEEKNEKLAFFIEHDELEKVSNAIIEMKSHIETETFSDAIAELQEGIFVLKHIEERNALDMKNIF